MIGGVDSEGLSEEEVAEIVRNVEFLKHLKDELIDNPQAVKIRVFKRGEIVESDSNQSEWIYFIKTGSVSVLKKLKDVPPRRLSRSRELDHFKKVKQLRNVSDEDFVAELYSGKHIPIYMYNSPYEMEKTLEQTLPGYLNHADRLGVVPYDDIIENHRQRIRRKTVIDVPSLPLIQINDGSSSELDAPADKETPPAKMTSLCLPPIRGSYFSKTLLRQEKSGEAPSENQSLYVKQYQEANQESTQKEKLVSKPRKSMTKVRTNTTTDSQSNVTGDHPIFLSVQVLEKGEYFGLNNLLHRDQPRLSLVSNGAKCVLISKKLFQQHLDGVLLNKLRTTENRYPKSAALQKKLQDLVNWNYGRRKIYNQAVCDKRSRLESRKQFHPQYLGEYCFRSGSEI